MNISLISDLICLMLNIHQNNYSHHHIHQQQGHDSKSGQLQLRRMGALAAALDAGDAVGKLMAEMLISSR